MNSKYSNFLTVLLVIVIIAIIGIIGFLGYRYIRSTNIKNDSQDFVNNFVGNQMYQQITQEVQIMMTIY